MSDSTYPPGLPPYIVVFGPSSNCTLDLCPLEYSVYRYRPSLPANITFIALYILALLVHAYLGFCWKQIWFMVCMILGCLSEIVGYVGRVLMHGNPFMFAGFMIQIVFITSGPIFYTAAIYITLSKAITHFSPSLSRIPPRLYYWIFIPADVICLFLQAGGGALSTVSSGSNQTGIDLAFAGLILQVIVIFAFCFLFADHMLRFFRHSSSSSFSKGGYVGVSKAVALAPWRMNTFLGGLAASILLILARCVFRCYELREGYSGETLSDEGLFIGLEGVLIVVAVFALCFGHPGLVFDRKDQTVIKGPESENHSGSSYRLIDLRESH
ncbi:hypothetical protein SAPIO_CDS6563 [Scedosporium apiospermum]|uniref:Sphingoid long-chain base transporter RSB1 n=1 Tax=Pseudallescheria apiosperma TaxID=563466 RepID=A0A084G3S4_PSEDA|nr:uncharacterized protein SAPIO_CDS6563 [Scedosporium apiospermum]KEZ41986.1 hypothetical protein SAPIO_CDS6563 [Scedosporium apiospermum]